MCGISIGRAGLKLPGFRPEEAAPALERGACSSNISPDPDSCESNLGARFEGEPFRTLGPSNPIWSTLLLGPDRMQEPDSTQIGQHVTLGTSVARRHARNTVAASAMGQPSEEPSTGRRRRTNHNTSPRATRGVTDNGYSRAWVVSLRLSVAHTRWRCPARNLRSMRCAKGDQSRRAHGLGGERPDGCQASKGENGDKTPSTPGLERWNRCHRHAPGHRKPRYALRLRLRMTPLIPMAFSPLAGPVAPLYGEAPRSAGQDRKTPLHPHEPLCSAWRVHQESYKPLRRVTRLWA